MNKLFLLKDYVSKRFINVCWFDVEGEDDIVFAGWLWVTGLTVHYIVEQSADAILQVVQPDLTEPADCL